MARILWPEDVEAVDSRYRGAEPIVEACDRRTRRNDTMPKLRHNTRRKLARKRSEDRLAFQERIAAKRSIARKPS